jgi:hypothetical protein
MQNTLQIDSELLDICRKINNENKTTFEWDLIESDDFFQTRRYVGGWDSTEQAFCFSHYNDDGKEHWFQINLTQVNKVQNGESVDILLRKPD